MARIHRLPPAVSNQIAAGEVVERPAAVVRELVENSIDAGASGVSVRVRRAGKAEIRVSDDGVGMSPEDARLALERHATSKIESVDDLAAIGSLGFRGEALPSIASVSRFRLRTREREADAGWEIRIEGGGEGAGREGVPAGLPTGMPPGTVVEVRDLFFNTPARRKFLRAESTESSHIVAAVSHLAVAWPQVRFDLESGGRRVLALDPAGDTASRLAQLEPRFCRDAITVAPRAGDPALRAFLSPPMAARGAASRLLLFVNGRPIRDRRLYHAVTEAYRRVSRLSGTPKAYMFLEIAPELVDFNVHPAKAEVRFSEPEAAYRAVFRGVLEALEGSPKQVDLGAAAGPPGAGGAGGRGDSRAREPVASLGKDGGRDGRSIGELLYGAETGEPAAPAYLGFGDTPPIVLGQFRRTYILAEGDDELLLIDQHAAEERVLFNGLMERSPAGGTLSLLQPVPLQLSPVERAALADERERLAAAGFEIESFGEDSWILRGVPEVLGAGRGVEVLMRSLAVEEGECPLSAGHDAKARIMARIACHAAITANVRLGVERMDEVLRSLWAASNPSTCPHGRPTVLRLDLQFLERRFRRR